MVNASEDALRALEAGESERARAILIEAELLAEEQYIRENENDGRLTVIFYKAAAGGDEIPPLAGRHDVGIVPYAGSVRGYWRSAK